MSLWQCIAFITAAAVTSSTCGDSVPVISQPISISRPSAQRRWILHAIHPLVHRVHSGTIIRLPSAATEVKVLRRV